MTAGALVFVSEATAEGWVREAAERGVREGYQAGWRAGWDARGREDEHAFARLSAERNRLARELVDEQARFAWIRDENERVVREANAYVSSAFNERDRVHGHLKARRVMCRELETDRDAWREAATALGEEAAALRAAAGRLLGVLDGPLNGSTARETLAAMSSLASLAGRP